MQFERLDMEYEIERQMAFDLPLAITSISKQLLLLDPMEGLPKQLHDFGML
jgi:hypothetical protein